MITTMKNPNAANAGIMTNLRGCDDMTIGQKMAFYRDVLGMSQRQLSIKSGLTSPAICQYESGKRIPDLKSFIKICRAFGVKTDKFLENVDI